MMRLLKSLVFTSCFAWIAACAAAGNGAPVPNGTSFAVGEGNVNIVDEGDEVGTTCPADNLTQPCTCDIDGKTYAGRQTCTISVGWGECECAAQQAGGGILSGPSSNKSSATFEWEETEPSTILPGGGGTCKGGHYSGVFSGLYNSPRMGNWDTSFSPVGLPVLGNVEFDLHQLGNGEYFEIRDGAMVGTALGAFPFKGDLTGKINCAGKEPVVEIGLKNGSYVAITDAYYFDGLAVAVYKKQDSIFDLGEWAVTEPEDYTKVIRNYADGTADLSQATYAPLPDITPGVVPVMPMFIEGGAGTWSAVWSGPEWGVGATGP